jgi:iron complex transport system substrate-binding protein
MPEGLTPGEIDAFVTAAIQRGEDLYHLDEGALAGLDADLVVTQDLCAVCAVDVSVVDDALAHLGCTAEVLTIDPHTLDEVLGSILTLGRATGHLAEAEALVAEQRRRVGAAWRHTMGRSRARVMFLEWTDPPFAPGHWIPEMIEIAGGEPVLATPGEKSRRVTWDEIHAASPDVYVVAPCGFDREGSQRLADELVTSGVLPAGVPVHAVDANASWARPGTRLPDGIDELGEILRKLKLGSSA